MAPFDDFLTYLASAHECSGIARSWADGRSSALHAVTLDADRITAHGGALAGLRDEARVAVVTIRSAVSLGPHAYDHIASMLRANDCLPAFVGRAPHDPSAALAVIDRVASAAERERAPRSFRVLAIVPAFNEADIIAQTLADLTQQDIDIHVIDNWSTDDTAPIAAAFRDRGVTVERFPASGPSATYDLTDILSRVEEIAMRADAYDWIVLHDADERRRGPWRDADLRHALWRVHWSGYDCIDHVTLNFWPTDGRFRAQGPDIEQQLMHFEPSSHPGHFHQRRAWRADRGRVSLAPSAGHDCTFPGRRVYPYKFLLKHYPIRSQAHGERKVLRERQARWNTTERARGWHAQYDTAASCFLRDPRDLERFDPASYWHEHLVQRLSGAGYFMSPPAWATPPKW